MNRLCKNLSLTIVILGGTPTFALPDSERVNLREACRQAVAGEYISAYDNVKASNAYLLEIERMIQRISGALITDRGRLAAMRQRVESLTYDIKLSDDVIHQTEKVKSLEATLELYRDQLDTARAKLSSVAEREKYLKKHIEPVFTIVRGVGSRKDYPISIHYKADCPKFRHMCALPLRYHEQLAKIMLKEESDIFCSRYISYSKLGKR